MAETMSNYFLILGFVSLGPAYMMIALLHEYNIFIRIMPYDSPQVLRPFHLPECPLHSTLQCANTLYANMCDTRQFYFLKNSTIGESCFRPSI